MATYGILGQISLYQLWLELGKRLLTTINYKRLLTATRNSTSDRMRLVHLGDSLSNKLS